MNNESGSTARNARNTQRKPHAGCAGKAWAAGWRRPGRRQPRLSFRMPPGSQVAPSALLGGRAGAGRTPNTQAWEMPFPLNRTSMSRSSISLRPSSLARKRLRSFGVEYFKQVRPDGPWACCLIQQIQSYIHILHC